MNDCPRQNPAYRPTPLTDEPFECWHKVQGDLSHYLNVLFDGIFWENVVECPKIPKS